MSAPSGSVTPPASRAFHARLGEYFAQATASAPVCDREISLAGQRLRLHFGCEALASVVMEALGHREVAPGDTPDLTICVWDSASSASPEFELPGSVPAVAPGAEVFGRDGPISFGMCASTRMLSALDLDSRTAFWWLPDGARYPWSQRASPLKTILHWWYASRGIPLVHAAAVARGDAGALLPGRSGSGKSTTALACAREPLALVSDDLCLVEPSAPARFHGIYRTARIATADLRRFPGVPAREPCGAGADEKALLDVAAHLATRRDAALRAVLVPRVTTSPRARLVPIAPAAALRALAPSTLFQFAADAGLRALTLRALAALVRSVPTYGLELGRELDSVREVVADLLADSDA